MNNPTQEMMRAWPAVLSTLPSTTTASRPRSARAPTGRPNSSRSRPVSASSPCTHVTPRGTTVLPGEQARGDHHRRGQIQMEENAVTGGTMMSGPHWRRVVAVLANTDARTAYAQSASAQEGSGGPAWSLVIQISKYVGALLPRIVSEAIEPAPGTEAGQRTAPRSDDVVMLRRSRATLSRASERTASGFMCSGRIRGLQLDTRRSGA